MSTEQAFVINHGHYDEEADDSKDTIIKHTDDDYLSFDPPLGSCSITDILELADWLGGKEDNDV